MGNAIAQLRAPSDPRDICKGHQKTSDQNSKQNVNQSKALFSFYEEPPVTAKFQEQSWKSSLCPTAPGASVILALLGTSWVTLCCEQTWGSE